MKRNIVRGSMLTVAALSLLFGGVSNTPNIREEVTETPVIVSKAIQNSVTNKLEMTKGTAVAEEQPVEVAEVPVTEEVIEPVVQVEEKEAVVESNQVVANIDSYLNIRTEPSEESEVVGKFYTGNVGTLVESGEEWSVVASGNAYGYVNNDYLLFGEEAEAYIENNCDQVARVTADTLNVRAEESTESNVVTQTDEGTALTILGQEGDWIKVAVTDDEVGYVASDYVYVDYVYETAVTIEEEQAAIAAAEAVAQAQAEAEAAAAAQAAAAATPATTEAPAATEEKTEATTENKLEETTEADTTSNTGSTTGQEIADYAVQFVGNPYVYGGTSLTNGADCSGFVQSVYKHFGYSLSRTAASQANDGKEVSLKNIQPGDLLFYHNFGHVAIYIGGGQVVHASTAATGIKISNYDYSPIDKAVRIVK